MSYNKQKYDWHKLKEEYFLSDFIEVKSFFEDKFRTYSGHIRKKTNGWTREKRDFARSILSQSVEICKEKRSIEMAESLKKRIARASRTYYRLHQR